jgi:hypothetical protein
VYRGALVWDSVQLPVYSHESAKARVCLSLDSEGGSRTNRVSRCSPCISSGFSFLWVSIKWFRVFWVCFGVATSVATCFLTVVLVASLLHSLAPSLLHGCVVLSVVRER